MIAVVGATGNTGRAVVKELKALGQNPVCVVRNVDKAREVLGVAFRRSSSAVVILGSLKTLGHSPNARLVVTMIEVRS